MKKLIVSLLLMCVAHTLSAQCGTENDAIKPGETLTYELKYNWKFVWVNAGWARMTTNLANYQGKQCLKTDLISYTNKKIDLFFKMRDTLTAITTQNLDPLYYRKGAEEGKRYEVHKVNYTYQRGKCYVNQERWVNGEYSKNEDALEVCVYDMLSMMVRARSFDPSDYRPGQRILFSMASGTQVEKGTLIYRGKKNFKAENDVTYRCLVFSYVEKKGDGKEKEIITFYVTDDRNHLPIRLDLYLNFGSAKAFLKEVKGNRYPLTSIVD